MAFKVIVSLKAQAEFYKAINYYADVSSTVPGRFINAIEETYSKLSVNPFFSVRYKNIRAVPVKGFPYLLFFTVDELVYEVKILSCFHSSLNPDKYPHS